MSATRQLLLLLLVPLWPSACAESMYRSALETRLLEMLQRVAIFARKGSKQDVALQLGWYSKTERFTIAAGIVDEGNAQRPVTAEDTFLFGSATKTLTAAAVMRLIDKGSVKADDRLCSHLNPYLQAQNGTTLEELFGPDVANATVLDVVRMSAGIPDYEKSTRDADVLRAGDQPWPVYDNLRFAAAYEKKVGGDCESVKDCACGHLPKGTTAICDKFAKRCVKAGPHPHCFNKPDGTQLNGDWMCWNNNRYGFCPTKNGSSGTVCAPGTCRHYSSASYEVAGLLLAAVGTPGRPYTDMDLGVFALPKRERYPSLTFPPVTAPHQRDEKSRRISQDLTVPGKSLGMFGNQGATIFNQHPDILGWTCGHMVGVAGDVARFYYDLFHPESLHAVVSDASLQEMTRTEPLGNRSWFPSLLYGAGIMESSLSQNASYSVNKRNRSQWGHMLGHGGLTYGFASFQGYSTAAAAGYTITTNTDSPLWAGIAHCFAEEIASELIGGQRVYLNCTNLEGLQETLELLVNI